jgi:hypothetical protein
MSGLSKDTSDYNYRVFISEKFIPITGDKFQEKNKITRNENT